MYRGKNKIKTPGKTCNFILLENAILLHLNMMHTVSFISCCYGVGKGENRKTAPENPSNKVSSKIMYFEHLNK